MSRLTRGEKEFLAPEQAPPAAVAGAGAVQELDARDLASPLPVLRAHRLLRGMQAGQLLRVATTHPLSVVEFQSLAKHVPHYELVSQESVDGGHVHLLRKRR